MAEDYSTWSYEDLVAEIQREEESLADLRKTLQDAEATIRVLEEQIVAEHLLNARERSLSRQRTIVRLQKSIADRALDIKRREERIAERERDIIRLQIFHASPYTIRAVRRIISSLRGWQTRRLTQQEHDERRLKRLLALQVKEEPLIPRLSKAREELAYWHQQVTEIRRDIAWEEARLERKKEHLWINFVYVIYYSYAGVTRHLEAHYESQCLTMEDVKKTVKNLAYNLLRKWVTKVGYAVPLLTGLTARDEGSASYGESQWKWGVQWGKQTKVTDHVTVQLEVFDFDYDMVRREADHTLPLEWWTIPQEELEKLLGISESE